MPLTKSLCAKLKFHHHAYIFVRDALSEAQEKIGREKQCEKVGHISPRELLDGVRALGQRRFGMMAVTVFRFWGISSTGDIGRIVLEMIDLGEMKKTDKDQFEDFVDVFSFEDAFSSEYFVDVSKAFQS